MKGIEKLPINYIKDYGATTVSRPDIARKLNEVIDRVNQLHWDDMTKKLIGEDLSHSDKGANTASEITPKCCKECQCKGMEQHDYLGTYHTACTSHDGNCHWPSCKCHAVREQSCKCACHENKLKQPYEHDSKCCDEMNGAVSDSGGEK